MRTSTYGNRMMLQVVIVLAVLVFVNLLSMRLFGRADLTANKAYSISESTKKALRGLDDVVNVKVYFSKKLPPYMTTLTRQVRDMLDEYRAYSGGKVVVDLQDPADDPATEQRVKMLGIPQVQLNVITKDRAEVMPGYLGIAVLYGDKSEVIPVVQSPSNLEYDLTSALLKVTRTEQKSVGFLTGHGEPDPDQALQVVKRALEQQYEVTRVALPWGDYVPPGVSTLVVAGPQKVDDWGRFAIDQFLMRGGQVLFMINKIGIAEGTLQAMRVDSGLDSLLAHYGVQVRPDLVVDRSCGTATFSAGYFSFSVPYPFWPMVSRGGFDEGSPITNQLEQAVFPWTSSIDVSGVAPDVEVAVLAKSSPQSWSETRSLNLDPQRNVRPAREEDRAPQDIAVLLRGRFTSYFTDRPIPAAADTASTVQAAPAPGEKLAVSPETQIILFGDSRFVEDAFLREYPENRTFFLNAVDWLTLGESLIGIRSRVVSTRPLKEIGEKSKATVRFASTLGIPLAVIAFGLVRRYVRSSRRRKRRQGPPPAYTEEGVVSR
jgi:ABC-2 type transport system permease protein